MRDETPADVDDHVLRQALEFAVGIAAAGVKLRPPLAFPMELKRFLRFHKLPSSALAQVRAAVERDDEFRGRLASVATAELVDEVGVLWLSRPDGWVDTIATLLPETIVDEQAAIHREERRRQAAQNAAARARAELLGVRAELERERGAKASVEVDVRRLRGELDDLRQRLREAQRAEHAAAQALAKVQAELVGATRAEPDPSPQPPAIVLDTEAVRAWIDGALSASTEVVRQLSAAMTELASVDDLSEPESEHRPRPGRARRKPIGLPGGVLAGSIEAAEFVLRTKRVKTLIDGYNVAKLGWPSLDLDHQREQCIMAAENLAKRWNLIMAVVFDGAEIEGAHTPTRRRVRVAYSPAGVSADDVLRAEVSALDVAQPVVVVTNDRAIISDVVAAGANTVSSDDFLVLLRR